jgi:PAS domain S-box-containing protein
MGNETFDTGTIRAILEGVNEAIIILGIDGTVRSANPSGMGMFGLTTDHFGKRFYELDLFNKETTKGLFKLFKNRLETDEKIHKEFKAVLKDGSERWLRIDSTIINDEEGKPQGLAAVIDDITERKRFEQALVESERRFRTVVESLQEGLGITDQDENIVYANESLSGLMGVSKDNIIGMNLSDFVSEDEFKRISARAKDRIEGRAEIYESKIISKDGDIKDVLISAAPWRSEEGDFLGSIGLLLDITERKNTEQALIENEEKYRATVEQSAENIYIYDIETNSIIESNPTLQDLLGYTAEEMKTLTPADFIAHSSENIGSQIMKVIKEGKAIVGERTYVRKDGSHVEVEVSASHIKYGDRSMLCVVSRDITERKRSREQLVEERNRAEFYLDLLAHDIGNLHHGILTGIDMVQMSENDRERRDRSLKLVRDLLLRSIKLVDNVMTFSSLRSMPLQKRPIDLKMLLVKGWDSAKEALPEKRSEHRLKCPYDGLEVVAEPLLQEAFFNIYHNALKYQKDEFVTVETSVEKMDDGKVSICISDLGPGIPDDRKDTIFDRVKEPMKRQHTGLGMAIVKALVERYSGSIHVRNRIPGDHKEGTSFVIDLPFSDKK